MKNSIVSIVLNRTVHGLLSVMAISLNETELFTPHYTKKKQSNSIAKIKQPFDKVQLTKLLIDTLQELGYEKSAIQLQEESGGVEVESTSVQKLFFCIKNGQFEKCTLLMLFNLPFLNGNLSHFASENLMNPQDILINQDAMRIDNIITKNWATIIPILSNECFKLSQILKNLSNFDAQDIIKFTTVTEVFVLVLRQVFIELVFVENQKALALDFLRSSLRPVIQIWDTLLTFQKISSEYQTDVDNEWSIKPDSTLVEMTSTLTCPINSIEAINIWGGSLEKSRQMTLDSISQYINPNDLVPRGRLITLLKQAIQYQRSYDLLSFDNLDRENNQELITYNLLQDNFSTINKFDFSHLHTLSENKDEIWYLEFSPNGKYLASASADSISDRKVLIYDVEKGFQVYKILSGSDQSVLYLSFSPDSNMLITCSFTEDAKVYNIHDPGESLLDDPTPNVLKPAHTIRIPFTDDHPSSSQLQYMRIWCCGWFHNDYNSRFIALGSPDRDVIIYNLENYSIFSRISKTMYVSDNTSNNDSFPHVHDLLISTDDKYLIVMNNETYIDVFDISNFHDDSDIHCFKTPRISRLMVGKKMTCMTAPIIKKYEFGEDFLLLISVQSQELQLWDYKRQIMVQKYVGQRQMAYIIRSCFGYDNNFVASGSEDGKVYIWDRFYGNIIGVISAHSSERPFTSQTRNLPLSKICNTVAWNPVHKDLFASGGDDGLIKIWKVSPE